MILISRPDNRGSKKWDGLMPGTGLWSQSCYRTGASGNLGLSHPRLCHGEATLSRATQVRWSNRVPTKWQGWGLSQGCLAPPEPWLMSSCLRNCCTQSQRPEHHKWDVSVGLKTSRELWRHGWFLDWKRNMSGKGTTAHIPSFPASSPLPLMYLSFQARMKRCFLCPSLRGSASLTL